MKSEQSKVYFADAHLSPAGKLAAGLGAGIVLLSAVLLAVLFVGLVLPLIIFSLAGLWLFRRWRLGNALTTSQRSRAAGEVMEGEYRVVEQRGKVKSP